MTQLNEGAWETTTLVYLYLLTSISKQAQLVMRTTHKRTMSPLLSTR